MGPVTWIVVVVAAIAVVALSVWSWSRRTRESKHNSNVIDLKSKLKDSRIKDVQACSKCRRKRQVTFYADDSGAVRGLCNECKKELSQHRELYPV